MKIEFNDKHNLLSRQGISRAETLAQSALHRFMGHLISVSITVVDTNGPRGGIDKECRVLVCLQGHNPIRVTANDQSVSAAIHSAIHRAARAVRRTVERKVYRNRRLQVNRELV